MNNTDIANPNFAQMILLVDDDRLILSTLTSGLERAGYQVKSVQSVDSAEVWLENNKPDLVILDVRMPNRNGLELTNQLDKLEIPFVLLTASSEEETIKRVVATGAMGYLVKPVGISQLIPTIEMVLTRSKELYSLRESEKQLKTALDANRSVSVAVGIVMDQHQINRDEAFKLIRNIARSERIKLNDLATNIVQSRETLNLKHKPTPI